MTEWKLPGYTELRSLGAGAHGRVVFARHDATGTPVAIKYLSNELCADTGFRERFRAEAQMLRRLRSPYVTRFHELVESTDGAAIVMEAVDGVALKAMLAERGPLPPEAALSVLKGSLLGLAAAHELGIVHRDYKPANVVVEDDGTSRLIDFGIAVGSGESGSRSGTPVYMAPEQWRAEPASPATDVYAATCVFFECVTGRRPYVADDQVALMSRHVTAPIPVDQVPEPLRPLIARGMAKRPDERPPGALAFVDELEAAATAAYGPEWESEARRRLAELAAGLSVLFPLAALGLSAGSGAAAGVGQAAAGQAAVAAAAKGTLGGLGGLGGLGAKGVVSVAGTLLVVTTGGAVIYAVSKDDAPRRPAPRPISFALAGLQEGSTAPPLRVNGRLVKVSGGTDPALVQRINTALRAPIDARIAEYRKTLGGLTPAPTQASVSNVVPRVTLGGPRYLSVRYEIGIDSRELWHSSWERVRTVTVDLRTGAAVKATELFTPAAVTGIGLRTLARRFAVRFPRGGPCGPRSEYPFALRRADLDGDGVQLALWPGRLEVLVDGPMFGGAMACGQPSAQVPFTELSGLLRPEVPAVAPAPGSSAPASSTPPPSGPASSTPLPSAPAPSPGRS